MGNRFLQTQSPTSISVGKPEIPEQTVDLLAWLPFTSCPLGKWALEGGEGGGGRQGNIYLFIYLSFHAQNNRDGERCFTDLVQINFLSLDSERRLVDVSRQRDGDAAPGENQYHVGSESAPSADDRAAIRAVLLHGNEQEAVMSSSQRFIFMLHIVV